MLTRLSISPIDGVFVGDLLARHPLGVGIEPNSAADKE
jgi:hypothetical protein